MCVYCMCADWANKYVPPPPDWNPIIPSIPIIYPVQPGKAWTREQYDELQEVLRRIKELEDKIGCPCDDYDPSKMEFLENIKKKLDELEGKVDERRA